MFIVTKSILSDDYGSNFLVPEIQESEFVAMRQEIKNQKMNNGHEGLFKTQRLLEHCYKLDRNQMPFVYRLLKVESIIPGYDPEVRYPIHGLNPTHCINHILSIYPVHSKYLIYTQ